VVSDPSVLATGSVTAGLILASNSTGTVVNGASVPIAIALRQETESPGIVGPTSITIGEETLGLPCNNCGPSSLAPDVALPIPVYVVSRNDNYNVTLLAESFNYAGPCTFEWTVKQGATTVAGSARPLTGGCLGTPLVTLYQTVWNLNLPEAVTPGPAVLAGAVIAGDHTYTVMQQILIH
jgi:hypothetical protein